MFARGRRLELEGETKYEYYEGCELADHKSLTYSTRFYSGHKLAGYLAEFRVFVSDY